MTTEPLFSDAKKAATAGHNHAQQISSPMVDDLLAKLALQQEELLNLRNQLAFRNEALDAADTHIIVVRCLPEDTVIEYCNRAVAADHGYDREELIGKSVSILAAQKWTEEEAHTRGMAMARGEKLRIEELAMRKDGSTFWVGVTIVPLRSNAEGNFTHFMSIGADITTRLAAVKKEKELQEQLLAEMKKRELVLLELRTAQKLESVGRLAAGIAHEINTPIQYVADSLYFLRSAFADIQQLMTDMQTTLESQPELAAAQMLQDFQAQAERIDLPFLQDEVPKAFERTFEGTTRVTNIVRAMKEFSHPDAGEFSPADINHALQNTLMVATNEYKYTARVVTQFAKELPSIMCNVGELNQVFLNLIVNAAHAIHDAGLDASRGEITITTALAGDSIEVSVSDNGCGIPKENLDKIYDPFFTTKEVGRGTGQGLAITHSIVVDKHSGSLQVYSEVGQGTQFIIGLPIEPKRKTATS